MLVLKSVDTPNMYTDDVQSSVYLDVEPSVITL